jgi:flagellar biogenesis protein FliO
VAHEFGRMILALSLVLGLLWLFARFARGRHGVKVSRSLVPGGGANRTAGRIEMLGRKSLGRHTSIAVVQVSDRTLVVGLTPQHITVLTELGAPDTGNTGNTELAGIAGIAGIDGIDGITGLSPLTEQDVALLGSAGPALGAAPEHAAATPWPASEPGVPTPKAWDAFVDGLREMTIRR